MDINGEKILLKTYQCILASKKPVGRIKDSECPVSGFYAFFTDDVSVFDGTILENTLVKGQCIFIGKSEGKSTGAKMLRQHLKNTGASSFRRFLAAVMKDRLGLRPANRGKEINRNNLNNFNLENEHTLTEFMMEHLTLGFGGCFPSLTGELEDGLIKKFGYPIFNLQVNNAEKGKVHEIDALRWEFVRDLIEGIIGSGIKEIQASYESIGSRSGSRLKIESGGKASYKAKPSDNGRDESFIIGLSAMEALASFLAREEVMKSNADFYVPMAGEAEGTAKVTFGTGNIKTFSDLASNQYTKEFFKLLERVTDRTLVS